MQSESNAATDPLVVVDASVWISAVFPQDSFHAVSELWLFRQTLPRLGVILPTLALSEITGAISRVSNDLDRARAVLAQFEQLPSVQFHALDRELATAAANIAIDLHLRGADAVYVALAARHGLPLITWDRELLERAAGRIEVRKPEVG